MAASAAAVLPAQQPEPNAKLATTAADAVAVAKPRFFAEGEFAALQRLGDILMPAQQNAPGAAQAGAAGFLDFLLGESPVDRQSLYREGLAALNEQSRGRYGKPFTDISGEQADALLAPLRQPWTYQAPSDPLADFLLAAKEDVMRATMNSSEWAEAVSGRSRSAAGLGLYWHPVE